MQLLKRSKTNISFVYDGRNGRPFSYTVSRDLNNDANFDNDLVYVPTGQDDPLVFYSRFFPMEDEALDALISATPGLNRYRGQVVPRNTDRAPWIHQVDLKITQEFRVWKDHRVEFSIAIRNLGNLIDRSPVSNTGLRLFCVRTNLSVRCSAAPRVIGSLLTSGPRYNNVSP